MGVVPANSLLPMAHDGIPNLIRCALFHQTGRNRVPEMVKLHGRRQAGFLANTHDDTFPARAILLGVAARKAAAPVALEVARYQQRAFLGWEEEERVTACLPELT